MLSETGRVEAFSDGVFTIAITLLVLEIKVPHELGDDELLGRALLAEWPMYLAYVTSFATIGMLWISHHHLFKFISRSDNVLFYSNLLVLLLVTFVPFPTALVAEYLGTDAQKMAMGIYAGTYLAISLAFLGLWRHASRKRRLISDSVDQAVVRGVTRAYTIRPMFRLAALLLAFINAYAAMLLTILLAMFFAIPPPPIRRIKSPPAPSR